MSPKSLLAAVFGGVAGAAIWAFALAVLNFELGIVAWLIGAMVGGLSAWAGGKGMVNGVLCSVIALLAIFAGKMYGTRLVITKAIAEGASQELYLEQQEDAAHFVALGDASEHALFMVEHGYTEAESPSDVSSDELESFRRNIGAWLRRFAAEGWSYDEYVASMTEGGELVAVVRENLGLLDLLFLALGLGTAFKLGRGPDAEVPGPEAPAPNVA